MSVKTKRDSDNVLHWKGCLTDLFTSAISLISGVTPKRPWGMVENLRFAMQLFKDGEFECFIVRRRHGAPRSPEEIQWIASTPIEATSLSLGQWRWLRNRGVMYVGEVFCAPQEGSIDGNDVQEWLGLHSLRQIDPRKYSWRPPYWDDARIVALWEKPIGTVITRHEALWRLLHTKGIHYVGQLLEWSGTRTRGIDRYVIQAAIEPESGIRVGMLLPSDWSAPVVVPDEWKTYQPSPIIADLSEDTFRYTWNLRRFEVDFGPRRAVELVLHPTGLWPEHWYVLGVTSVHRLATLQRQELSARFATKHGYVMEKDLESIERALQGYSLRLGMTLDEVQAVLGPPVHLQKCEQKRG